MKIVRCLYNKKKETMSVAAPQVFADQQVSCDHEQNTANLEEKGIAPSNSDFFPDADDKSPGVLRVEAIAKTFTSWHKVILFFSLFLVACECPEGLHC